mmetsp:Transcript_6366/g.14129  ORF Transcript_6366/g.14129 Transcript_6366/m.14129 type:complete len:249 (+) Transcript_6366:574-1320(+)
MPSKVDLGRSPSSKLITPTWRVSARHLSSPAALHARRPHPPCSPLRVAPSGSRSRTLGRGGDGLAVEHRLLRFERGRLGRPATGLGAPRRQVGCRGGLSGRGARRRGRQLLYGRRALVDVDRRQEILQRGGALRPHAQCVTSHVLDPSIEDMRASHQLHLDDPVVKVDPGRAAGASDLIEADGMHRLDVCLGGGVGLILVKPEPRAHREHDVVRLPVVLLLELRPDLLQHILLVVGLLHGLGIHRGVS